MNVLIIEDEKPAAQKMMGMLNKIDPSVKILNVLESIEETINWLGNNPRPDLMFMDIHLDDGLCFEIFETIHISIPVIFTTAYDQYAIKAFKVNSIDYLLKPIKQEDLENALQKFRDLHAFHQEKKVLHKIATGLQKNHKERFFLKVGLRYKSVQTQQVNCFYIQSGSVFLLTAEGKSYDLDYSLDTLEEMIDPARFFRVNRNFIINIESIKDIVSYSSNRLKLIVEHWNKYDDVIVSRDRVRDFKNWMDR